MRTRASGRGLWASLLVAVLGVVVSLEGCGSTSYETTSDAEGGASERPSAPDLGASTPCPGTTDCVVGQSYCELHRGGAGGADGGLQAPSSAFCRMIPQGTACAANPTCANCASGCMCSDAGGVVTVMCLGA